MFEKLNEYLEHLDVPSCDILIRKDHKVLFRSMYGHSDYEKKVPLTGNETYCMYSCSKTLTSCAVMQLIERGLLSPDDPVYSYLPAYKELKVLENGVLRPARTTLTIRHLLSMQSGMNYGLNSPEILAENKKHNGQATTRQLVDAMALTPLSFDPGTDFLYSLSHDVLAAVVEVISGMRFSEYLKQNIFEPVGMRHTGFSFTDEIHALQCAQYRDDPDRGQFVPIEREHLEYRLSPEYESGGAGIISCTEDMAAFADAIASGSTEKGCSLLQPETINLWRTPQLCAKGKASFDLWKRFGYSYAMGVRTRVDTSIGRGGPKGEFGWDGAAASYIMMDPENHLSFFMTMHVRSFGKAYNVIHPTVQTLIYDELSGR